MTGQKVTQLSFRYDRATLLKGTCLFIVYFRQVLRVAVVRLRRNKLYKAVLLFEHMESVCLMSSVISFKNTGLREHLVNKVPYGTFYHP